MKMQIKFLLILIFTGFTAWSQVKFDARVSKETLGVNERLRVDFEMNQDGDNFRPPSFQGFTVVGGPNQSISKQWVNGKASFSKTFSYFLQPKATGMLKIGQAEIDIDGTTYKTLPVEINVTGAVDLPKDPNDPVVSAAENVHLVAEVSKSDPYLNEAFTVAYKLYVSRETSVTGWNEVDAPKFSDFWSQSVDEKQFKIYDGSYNGKPYRYVILRRTLLYPQKTGELTIEPLALNINVEAPTNRRDIFGMRITRPAQITVTAPTRKVNVKPLPEDGKPESFTGAVGTFDFDVTASKTKLDAQEALDLTLSAKGNGNLKLFNLPKPKLPSSLEVYEPENEQDIRVSINGMSGKNAQRYTIVPQQKGNYPIPPIKFSYFDPVTEQYKTLSSDEIIIDVENGPAALVQNTNKVPVEAQKQFSYIKSEANLNLRNRESFFGTTLFWSMLGTPVLLIPLVIFFGRKRREYQNDVKGNRLRKADKLARKYLSEAKKNLGDQTAFYLALEKCLHNYLKARLNIQTSEMSKERISQLLQERGVTVETTANFLKLLESCEFARYTPASSDAMQHDYDQASQVISDIDKQL
ncbi:MULTISPECIES: BatD family protein [unclassified Leeuwenhoekiella]|uniref:BatD family protein n=1 Tax=unclassified Leeuwenhoekiella TaxID=2615029 RepID=UPI000C592CAF|nr:MULTISPECIES: BatD family protein [unclassified Leeuwenhoekiella]MAW95870.1 BatD protein [Leeuwenhoekiella sp.]MBA82859.1 BatD protein [Leeuwenhoekiella sp.]